MDLETGSVFAGHRIDGRAGKGGMGVVYRATDLQLDRPVALKLVAPDLAEDAAFAERFKRESRLAASLDHPNVIPIYHAGEEDGRLYVTMRLVEGTDLAEVLRRDKRLSPERTVAIAVQVGAALDAAHARGLVHRDVKPANILIEGDHVFLTDFGLSKHAQSNSDLTDTGTFLGTVDYIAPEQAQGGIVDARSDVYALACVLFHMLSGRIPFERPNSMAKLVAHVSDEPAVLKDVPGDLAAVVRRGMEKDPGRRYQSAGELAGAAAAATGISPAAPTSRPATVARRTPRTRRTWIRAGAAGLAVAVIVGAIVILSGGGSDSKAADRSAIHAVIARVQRGTDAGMCRRDMTAHFLDAFYAPRTGRQALLTCEIEFEGSPPSSEPLAIRDMKIDGDLASAVVTLERQPVTFYLAKRNGRWRLNDFSETTKIRYERQLELALTTPFKPAKQMEAVIQGRARLKTAGAGPADAVRVFADGVRQLQRVTPPSRYAQVHSDLVAATDAMKQDASRVLAAQKSGDAAGFAAAERTLGIALRTFGAAQGAVSRLP